MRQQFNVPDTPTTMPDPDTDSPFAPIQPARVEWRDGEPFSPAFEDHYFSRDNGPAETRHVFLDGNDLSSRFAALSPGDTFVIGETGFGTGLNFLCAAMLFAQRAPESCRLHFVSVEKYPLRHQDLALALQRWPDLSTLGAELVANWPALTPGFHRRHIMDGRVILTLMFGDAHAMLAQLDARVDAWFLDGFAPARNQAMWQSDVFAQLARLSHRNTTLATFTAAGFVRRGLDACGFRMQRQPGFGSKREMLTGHFTDAAPGAPVARPTVAIVGAGLAGCTLASALVARGIRVSLFDQTGIAAGASGNLAGVVYTSASAHATDQNRFYQSSYLYALSTLQQMQFPANREDGALSGVIQLPKNAAAADKAEQALVSGLWPETELRAGTSRGATELRAGGYVSPPRWCQHLLSQHALNVQQQQITAITPNEGRWQLRNRNQLVGEYDQLVLCNAAAATALVSLPWLTLKSIRGQVSQVRATHASQSWQQAICHGGYLTPEIGGQHCVGATFDQGDDEPNIRDIDDQRNLAQLKQYLPEHWQQLGGENARVTSARVGFRCQSTDFLPLAGPLGETDPALQGVWLNIAHGSRGITGTPLCAELIASGLCGEPLPIDRSMRDALAPARFIRRKNRKAGRRTARD